MHSVSEFAEFTDRIRVRRESAQVVAVSVARELAAAAAAPPAVAAASQVVEEVIGALSDAEQALRAQNDALLDARLAVEAETTRYRELFDLAPAAYLVTDADGRIEAMNDYACALFGKPRNALCHRPLVSYVDLAERAIFRTSLSRCVASPGINEWPVRLVPSHGPPVDCRVRVRALRTGPGSLGTTLYWHLTEERRAEDLF